MNTNDVIFSEIARGTLQAGVDKVANAVKVTLGPGGRNVVIDSGNEWMPPKVTKDGVTVARMIRLKDRGEAMGAQLLKEAATKTNDKAGDGTTTSTVLAQALVHEGLKQVGLKRNGVRLKAGMDQAARDVVDVLNEMAIPIDLNDKESLKNIATISGNQTEVGEVVAEAFASVGKNGVVTYQGGNTNDTTIKVVEGMAIDTGLQSPYFITDPDKMACILEKDVHVMLFEEEIRTAKEIQAFLTKFVKEKGPAAKLCIIGNVTGEALYTLVLNRASQKFLWAYVKCPGHGDRMIDWMRDIAALTNAKVVTKDLGVKVENFDLNSLGIADKIVIENDLTTIVGSVSDEETKAYVDSLIEKKSTTEAPFVIEFLDIRIAKLTSGIAIINIGAVTESELEEKKYRYEDAVSATSAALRDGIVPGGGIALLRAQKLVRDKFNRNFADKDEQVGYDLLLDTLSAPLIAIAENAGYNGGHIVQMVANPKIITGKRGRPKKDDSTRLKGASAYGFNARTGDYVDMFEAGIIDPAYVTKQVVMNSTSVAGTILMLEAAIVNDETEKAPQGY